MGSSVCVGGVGVGECVWVWGGWGVGVCVFVQSECFPHTLNTIVLT